MVVSKFEMNVAKFEMVVSAFEMKHNPKRKPRKPGREAPETPPVNFLSARMRIFR